jgi:hypothetical protein
MNRSELKRFVFEAQNIVDGYTSPLPDGVSIDCAEDVILASPHHTVHDNPDSVSVLAWVTIPKDYFITNAPATAGDD